MILVIQNITGIKKFRNDLWRTAKISTFFCKKTAFFHNTVIKVNHTEILK